MQYRKDKVKDKELSALGMGCMRFPRGIRGIDAKETEKLILRAYECGVNYFDTAYIYGGSEKMLGEILKKHNLRDKINIATKLPHGKCHTYADFDKLLGEQLQSLNTSYIDYYLIHNLSSMDEWGRLKDLGIERWVQAKKDSGEIKSIGFSFHGTQSSFIEILNDYGWEFCQIQLNYINTNYQAGLSGMHSAAAKGLPIIIMEPLLGGKLATGLPKKAVEALKNADPSSSPARWALRWLYNLPEVTVVLSGMNDEVQIIENVKIAEESLPSSFTEAETTAIEHVVQIFNDSYKVPCTGCNYCMPCPSGVNIPAIFSAYNAYHAISRFSGFQQYMTSVGMDMKAGASKCTACGACMAKCPQHIDIAAGLRSARKKFEPWWIKPVLKIFMKFM